MKSSKAWDQVDGGVEAYISFSHSLCEPTSHQRTCGTGILKSWKARHSVTSRPTSPVVTGFVCHETKAAVSLLALSRLKAVRLCIRSALHQIKRLIHPQGLTSVAGCPSVCLSPTAGQAKTYRKGDLGWPSAKELLTSLIVHDCPWHGCPLIELFPAREPSLSGACPCSTSSVLMTT